MLRDDTHMTSIVHWGGLENCPIFKKPPTPMSEILQPHDLERPISNNPPPPTSFLPPLQITNQLKGNITLDDYYMLSGISFRSAFIFSINSLLILSDFPLTFLHLAILKN